MEPFQRSGGALGGPKRTQNGPKWSFWCHKRVLWLWTDGTVWNKGGTSQGTSKAMQWSLCTGLEWPSGDVWSLKIAFCGHLWPFGILLGPSVTPRWPSLTRETVPMHHWGCALTCSTLVSHCSTSSETQDLLMAPNGDFGRFGAL